MEHLEEILHLFIATDQSKPIRAVQYIFYQKLPHYSVPEVPQAGDEGKHTSTTHLLSLFCVPGMGLILKNYFVLFYKTSSFLR